MKTIHLNGADFVYDIAGETHDETIIVLHGGRGIGDHRSDFQVFAPLTDQFRVLAYDQRGCGATSLTPPYTFGQFADDLEAFRQHFLGDKKLILIGGSFGGMIALTYAVKYGDKLSHLILRGTAASHHHEAEAIANFNARLHKATSASIGMVDKMFSDKVVDDVELRLIWMALQPLYYEHFDPDAAMEKTRTLQLHAETHNELFKDKSYDLLDKLEAINVPTFVVCGGEDWICPPSQSRIIADKVPGAEYLEVPGANHPVHAEKPEIVLPAIRDFIARRRG